MSTLFKVVIIFFWGGRGLASGWGLEQMSLVLIKSEVNVSGGRTIIVTNDIGINVGGNNVSGTIDGGTEVYGCSFLANPIKVYRNLKNCCCRTTDIESQIWHQDPFVSAPMVLKELVACFVPGFVESSNESGEASK
jgi:hypothetical protein